jgi:LacI family transcriptional regulator
VTTTQAVQRRATMRDVAHRAGVSVMTVSRVVNDSDHVEAGTRERVQAAISALGYRQHAAASALRRSGAHTTTIGMVLDDVANPFCSTLQRGVERVCRDQGHLLVAGSSGGDAAEERELVSAFLLRRVDGLVIMGADDDHAYLAEEMRHGVPVVFTDRSPAHLDADRVISDNVGGGRLATEHLLLAGHRRIALLTGEEHVETSRRRRDGYRQALAAAGVPLDPDLERGDLSSADAAQHALDELLQSARPPTAVFAGQNLVTIGALRALHLRGRQHQVALVGFDEIELAGLLDPPVTVVTQDPDEMGAVGAGMLFERLAGFDGPARTRMIPTRLLIRGSGELPPPT